MKSHYCTECNFIFHNHKILEARYIVKYVNSRKTLQVAKSHWIFSVIKANSFSGRWSRYQTSFATLAQQD